MSPITVNEAVSRFQELIKIKTVSAKDGNFDKEEFARFLPRMKELYPDAFSVLEAELINEFGILLRWKGKTAVITMTLFPMRDRSGNTLLSRLKSTTTAYGAEAQSTQSASLPPF